MVYKCLIKKTSCGAVKNDFISHKELPEQLHKPIIRKFEKRKKHLFFIDNIWGAHVADMQLITKFNTGFRFLLFVIGMYSKYEWVIPLQDKRGITITNAFQNFLNKSKRKPNKIWVDKGREFDNKSIKSFLQNKDREMYSTHKEGKFLEAERFIRTLKIKFINI